MTPDETTAHDQRSDQTTDSDPVRIVDDDGTTRADVRPGEYVRVVGPNAAAVAADLAADGTDEPAVDGVDVGEIDGIETMRDAMRNVESDRIVGLRAGEMASVDGTPIAGHLSVEVDRPGAYARLPVDTDGTVDRARFAQSLSPSGLSAVAGIDLTPARGAVEPVGDGTAARLTDDLPDAARDLLGDDVDVEVESKVYRDRTGTVRAVSGRVPPVSERGDLSPHDFHDEVVVFEGPIGGGYDRLPDDVGVTVVTREDARDEPAETVVGGAISRARTLADRFGSGGNGNGNGGTENGVSL